jgi:hypothetical protein
LSTRRTTLTKLLGRLDTIDLTDDERTLLRPLLKRELERYSERGAGRPRSPTGQVREVQLLRDMRETLDELLSDTALSDADREELTRWRDQHPATLTKAIEKVSNKHHKSPDAVRKAVTKHGNEVRTAHAGIKLGADSAPKNKRRK